MTIPAAFALSPCDHHFPDFFAFTVTQWREALDYAMTARLEAAQKVSASNECSTFTSVCVPLEEASAELNRVFSTVYSVCITDAEGELKTLRDELSSILAAHNSAMAEVEGLATKLGEVAKLDLPEAQQRLVDDQLRSLRHAGGLLPDAQRTEMASIDAQLAKAMSSFSSKTLDASNAAAVHVPDVAALDGMAGGDIEAAVAGAKERGLEGGVITMSSPVPQPVLEVLSSREVRQKVWESSMGRGRGEFDTSEEVLDIVRLRARKAQLLGAKNFAELAMEGQTAPSAEAVLDTMREIVPQALEVAAKKAAELGSLAQADGVSDFAGYDWDYYLAKAESQGAGVDLSDAKSYFGLDAVRDHGLFGMAQDMFGVRFERRDDLPVHHEDVEAFEVFDGDTSMGIITIDWFARATKRGGAWMMPTVNQTAHAGRRPVVTCNLNVTKPSDGGACALTFEEVTTAFHEFGHVMHGMLGESEFAAQSGASVARDFVEFPSQVNEMWALHPYSLPRFAKHVDSGEDMPVAMAEALRESKSSAPIGYTVQYMAATVLDLEWNILSPEQAATVTDVDAFEAEVMERWGFDQTFFPPRYRSRFFSHCFELGYAAGYYSYLWSEIIAADAELWLSEGANAGAEELRERGLSYRREVLARGDERDPLGGTRTMLGRDVRREPYMERTLRG